ncbi:MAG: hypothetical protein LN412_08505 [Candidatus Thermoplasmatota archaeon]|nr:hypothetical protein [Candidatus Thermoplasmatota archaeon]
MMRSYERRRGLEMEGQRKGEKAQFNIRMDRELLENYRSFCDRNGLDPQRQVINFIKRLLEAEFDFQEKLWQVLMEGEGR